MKLKKVQMDTKVDPAVRDRLIKIAEELNLTRAEICRAAFKVYIEEYDRRADEQSDGDH